MDATGFTPLGLDHVVLRVRDLARSERFYCDVLGGARERLNASVPLLHLRFGDALIDLRPAAGELPPPETRGVDHVCLSIRCADVAALAVALRARGVPVEGDPATRFGAFGEGGSIYVRDPDGYMIELKPRAGLM